MKIINNIYSESDSKLITEAQNKYIDYTKNARERLETDEEYSEFLRSDPTVKQLLKNVGALYRSMNPESIEIIN